MFVLATLYSTGHRSHKPTNTLFHYLLISLPALFVQFWLGSATGHDSHTPITTLFQYPFRNGIAGELRTPGISAPHLLLFLLSLSFFALGKMS